MDINPVDVVSRWAHVGTAILLVGGTAFFRLAVIPALGENSNELVTKIRDNWRKFVHIGILLFLVSGFYNYFRAIPLHKGDDLYHGLVGTKMLLAFYVFFLASVLVLGLMAAFYTFVLPRFLPSASTIRNSYIVQPL